MSWREKISTKTTNWDQLGNVHHRPPPLRSHQLNHPILPPGPKSRHPFTCISTRRDRRSPRTRPAYQMVRRSSWLGPKAGFTMGNLFWLLQGNVYLSGHCSPLGRQASQQCEGKAKCGRKTCYGEVGLGHRKKNHRGFEREGEVVI